MSEQPKPTTGEILKDVKDNSPYPMVREHAAKALQPTTGKQLSGRIWPLGHEKPKPVTGCTHPTDHVCSMCKPTTGEWTAATVSKLIDEVSLSGVADAHNAALAVRQQHIDDLDAALAAVIAESASGLTEQKLANQLAAERGRCERGLCKGAALFAGKEAETIHQLRKQLEVQQQRYDLMVHAACVDNRTIDNLRDQLAAEREKVQQTENIATATQVELDGADKVIQQLREQLTGMELELQRSNAKCAEKASKTSDQTKPTTGEQRCPGPRQHGHPLVYESHCDHGETQAHVIKPTGEWTAVYERTSNGWYVCSNGEPAIEWPFTEREARNIAAAHKAALAANDHKWNLARLSDIKELTDKHARQLNAEQGERCEVCNTELSQCGPQGVDGEPSMDCLVCKLREQLAAAQAAALDHDKRFSDCVMMSEVISGSTALAKAEPRSTRNRDWREFDAKVKGAAPPRHSDTPAQPKHAVDAFKRSERAS